MMTTQELVSSSTPKWHLCAQVLTLMLVWDRQTFDEQSVHICNNHIIITVKNLYIFIFF